MTQADRLGRRAEALALLDELTGPRRGEPEIEAVVRRARAALGVLAGAPGTEFRKPEQEALDGSGSRLVVLFGRDDGFDVELREGAGFHRVRRLPVPEGRPRALGFFEEDGSLLYARSLPRNAFGIGEFLDMFRLAPEASEWEHLRRWDMAPMNLSVLSPCGTALGVGSSRDIKVLRWQDGSEVTLGTHQNQTTLAWGQNVHLSRGGAQVRLDYYHRTLVFDGRTGRQLSEDSGGLPDDPRLGSVPLEHGWWRRLPASGAPRLVVGGKNGVQVLSLDTPHAALDSEASRTPVEDLALAEDGRVLVTRDATWIVRSFDAVSGEALAAHPVWPSGLSLPELIRFIPRYTGHHLALLAPGSGLPLHEHTFDAVKDPGYRDVAAVLPGETGLILSTNRGRLARFDLGEKAFRWTAKGPGRDLRFARISPDGARLWSYTSRNHRLVAWDLETGEELDAWELRRHGHGRVTFRAEIGFVDGRPVLHLDGALYGPLPGGELEVLRPKRQDTALSVLHPDGERVVVDRRGGGLRLERLGSEDPGRPLLEGPDAPRAMVFSPDGGRLFVLLPHHVRVVDVP